MQPEPQRRVAEHLPGIDYKAAQVREELQLVPREFELHRLKVRPRPEATGQEGRKPPNPVGGRVTTGSHSPTGVRNFRAVTGRKHISGRLSEPLNKLSLAECLAVHSGNAIARSHRAVNEGIKGLVVHAFDCRLHSGAV